MKIGSRSSARPRVREYTSYRVSTEDYDGGIGRAIEGLGNELVATGIGRMEVAKLAEERGRKLKRSKADIEFNRLQRANSLAAMERTANAQPGAEGLTNRVDAELGGSFEDFAARTGITDDPELMDEYRARHESFRTGIATDVFKVELEEGQRHLGQLISEEIDASRTSIHDDPTLFDAEFGEITQIIDDSDLSPLNKEALKKQAYNSLAGTVFQKETEMAAADELPVGPVDGSRPVAAGLLPQQVAILQTIAGPESGGQYNVRYNNGGDGTPSHFSDYSDHPRIYSQTKTGDWSSAAGRYQFTASTWDDTVRQMRAEGYEINDFSPVNQDRAAAWLAETRYRAATGRDLNEVLSSGDREAIKSVRAVLAPTWEGFAHMSDDAFANAVLGSGGLRLGGTGHSQAPDIWNDERFADLDFDTKMEYASAADTAIRGTRAAQATAEKNRQESLTNTLLLSFRNNEPGAERAANEAVRQGQITDAALVSKLDAQMTESRERTRGIADISQKAALGQVLTVEDSKNLGYALSAQGIDQGLSDQDPATSTRLAGIAAETGMVPKQQMDILSQQLASTNPATQGFALFTIADIYNRNPRALSSATKEIQEMGAFAATLTEYGADPMQAVQEYNLLMSPEGAKTRKILAEGADKSIEESGLTYFFNQSTTWWARNLGNLGGVAPRIPERPEDALSFQDDYRVLYEKYYVMHGGNAELAHSSAGKAMAGVWHPSPITGALMKNSPSAPNMGVPPLNGDYSWVEPSVREFAEAAEGEPVSIVSDAQTTQTQPPTYRVVKVVNGLPQEVPGRMEMKPARAIMQAKTYEAQLSNAAGMFKQAERAFIEGRSADVKRLEESARQKIRAATPVDAVRGGENQRQTIEAAIRALDLEEDRVRAEPGAPVGMIPAFEARREELFKMLEALK